MSEVGGGNADATYLTEQDETASLPNSLRLVPGSNVSFDIDTSGNTLEISASVSGVTTFVAQNTVTGAAATTLSISGLDLDADECYLIQIDGDNPTGSTANLSLYFNADTTSSNYWVQVGAHNAATTTAARNNNGIFLTPLTTESFASNLTLRKNFDDFAKTMFQATRGDSTSMIESHGVHQWADAANITTIVLSSSVASALAIGTRIRIWKLST